MATDYKSSLPVRTEGDIDERLQMKIVDSTDVTKQAEVDADRTLQVTVNGKDETGTNRRLRVSQEGHVGVNGVYNASTNTDPATAAMIAHTRATTPGEAEQNKRVTAVTSGTRHALDVAITDESGNPFTESNPLPVVISESEGQELQDYFETATSVAAGGNDQHTYTVPAGKTLKLDQVMCACSGLAKFTVEVSQDGTTFAKLATRFNSTAAPNADCDFKRIISVPTGGKVRITRENRDKQPLALYSTIVGVLL